MHDLEAPPARAGKKKPSGSLSIAAGVKVGSEESGTSEATVSDASQLCEQGHQRCVTSVGGTSTLDECDDPCTSKDAEEPVEMLDGTQVQGLRVDITEQMGLPCYKGMSGPTFDSENDPFAELNEGNVELPADTAQPDPHEPCKAKLLTCSDCRRQKRTTNLGTCRVCEKLVCTDCWLRHPEKCTGYRTRSVGPVVVPDATEGSADASTVTSLGALPLGVREGTEQLASG